MTIEQRLDQLEKRNKRLTVALTLMAVAMCAAVTMAATGNKRGEFDTVVARDIFVKNDMGRTSVSLTTGTGGSGLVRIKQLNDGLGMVELGSSYDGGMVVVYNKTGERIVRMNADEYGNGLVGAYNRKGMGREFRPGP